MKLSTKIDPKENFNASNDLSSNFGGLKKGKIHATVHMIQSQKFPTGPPESVKTVTVKIVVVSVMTNKLFEITYVI